MRPRCDCRPTKCKRGLCGNRKSHYGSGAKLSVFLGVKLCLNQTTGETFTKHVHTMMAPILILGTSGASSVLLSRVIPAMHSCLAFRCDFLSGLRANAALRLLPSRNSLKSLAETNKRPCMSDYVGHLEHIFQQRCSDSHPRTKATSFLLIKSAIFRPYTSPRHRNRKRGRTRHQNKRSSRRSSRWQPSSPSLSSQPASSTS